ncbi:flagellar basal body P-ring protein FlgI [Phycisphaerales bacterium AB-hyl4]|uniref:Flagellar basal body P-ring protein FlgI n=1 Tax=Natronomicrosphaera hydrolytica TaxID=3242702 RepID=A0ABV4U6R1_9BACT
MFDHASTTRFSPRWIVGLIALIVFALPAHAVQVQDIVRLKGAEKNTLVGMGLVIGLDGTGDGGKFLPAMRPLAEVIGQLIDPNVVASELQDARNVALVALTADLSGAGVREGDRVDVHVASVGPARSLRGGRLFLIPMTGPMPGSPVFAFAQGAVTVEDRNTPTVGVVKNGAQLTRDIMARYFDERGRLTLVLNDANASWPVANNLASLINGLIAPDGPNVARAVDQRNVVVQVPPYERDDPAAFISQILTTYMDPSQVSTGARVVINERTGTIVISGDVQVSPVIISHKGLTITTVTPPPGQPQFEPEVTEENFIAFDPENRAGAKLADLLNAFNQLKVPAEDRIAILRLMHESGKLHAQLIVE